MPWGSKTAGTQQTLINNSTPEVILSDIDLKPGETAHVQVRVNNESGSVTDPCIISVYTSLGDTTYDDFAAQEFEILPAGIGDERISIVISGVSRFKIEALSGGATDTYTADTDYQLDGVDL